MKLKLKKKVDNGEVISPEEYLSRMQTANCYVRVFPELVAICDKDYAASIILARIFFWSDKMRLERNGTRILAKTATDFEYETGVDRQTAGRACRYLKKIGLIDYYLESYRGRRSMFITMNYPLIFKKYQDELAKTGDGKEVKVPEYLMEGWEKFVREDGKSGSSKSEEE